MPSSRRDKTTGLPIPSPVVPATSICFTLQVPNAIEYRSALKGALSSLGQAWTWAQTAGQNNDASYQAAELWRQRLNDAFYDLDCSGGTMSCDDVADCIETSPAVRAALDSFIPAVPIDGMIFPPGVPLTPGQMTMRLNPIDACAFDPYWAQVEQYVDYMVDLGQDVLDQIALYNSALDLGENVPMGKFLGKIKNTSGGGKVLEFLQWVLTTVKAAYEAADNTANRDAIKCDIFCQFRDDCLITIQGTLDVLNERLGGLLSPGDLDDLDAMINAFLTVTFNPALALDLWVLFLMGAAKTAGMFGLQGIDETLQLVLEVAVNDANNDWETKCDDCDEPPPPDPACRDFTIERYDWDEQAGTAWDSGVGFWSTYSAFYNESTVRVWREASPGVANKVVLTFSIAVTNVQLYQQSGGVNLTYTGTPSTTIEFSPATFPGTWANYNAALGIAVNVVAPGDLGASFALTDACVYFAE